MDRVIPTSIGWRASFAVALALALALAGCARRPSAPAAGGVPAELPEHLARSIAALGYPGAQRAFRVGGGCLVSSGDGCLEWGLGDDTSAVTVSPILFERDGVPVAHWSISDANRIVRFEAAAMPDPALGDSSLVLAVRATAEWRGAGSGSIALDVGVRPAPPGIDAPPPDAPDTVASLTWDGRRARRDGAVVAVVDPAAVPVAADSGASAPALRARCRATLRAGERQSWEFWMPLYPLTPRDADAVGRRARADDVLARARAYWRGELARGTRFESPDTLQTLAWRAALVTLLIDQLRVDERWMPLGSPFQYRDVWIRDGVRVARALALAGRADRALDDVRSLARFQLPDGVFLSQRGQLDGTGQMLWAFDQTAALADTAAAREFLPAARAGFAWLAAQRRATRAADLPWPGMLPAVEPRDMEMTRAHFTGNDAWAIAGFDATARLAARAGDESLRVAATREAADARAAFARALARTGSREIPPSWEGYGGDWGNASAGYPTFAVAAADPRLAALARRMRAHGDGLVVCDARGHLHSYLGADLAQSSLLADRPAEAGVWLDGLLTHSSATLGQAEAFDRDGDFAANFPPHGTAAAMLIDLLRNRLVDDNGDTLVFGRGLALGDWRGTRLTHAPTRAGVIDLGFEHPAPGTFRVSWSGEARVRVRVPDDAPAIDRVVGGRFVAPHWIDADRGARVLTIAFRGMPR